MPFARQPKERVLGHQLLDTTRVVMEPCLTCASLARFAFAKMNCRLSEVRGRFDATSGHAAAEVAMRTNGVGTRRRPTLFARSG